MQFSMRNERMLILNLTNVWPYRVWNYRDAINIHNVPLQFLYRNHITNWYLVYRSNGQSLITAQEGQEKWLEDIIVFITFKICSEQFHDVSHVRSFLMFTNQSKICIGHTRVSRLKLWRLAKFFIPAAICQFKLYGIFSMLISKQI